MTLNRIKNQNSFTAAQWDKRDSTFMQRIFFTNGRVLTGYSKRMDHNESPDDLKVLRNWVLRMLRDGYLDKRNPQKTDIDRIEYYLNETQEHVFTLHYEYFECVNEIFFNSKYYQPFVAFLEEFYRLINQGRSSQDIYSRLYLRARVKATDPLDFQKKRFTNPDQLKKYVQEMVSLKGYSSVEVDHFVLKYSQKHFGEAIKINWN